MVKIEQYKWIFDAIGNIDDNRPTGFILKKRPPGDFNTFKLKTINTSYFKNKLKSTLNEIQNNVKNGNMKINKFHNEDTDQPVYYELDASKYNSIKNTIAEIFRSDEANNIGKLKTLHNAKLSAMLFEVPNHKSIIAIDSVSIFDKSALKKMGLVATYDENGLNELSKDAVLLFKFGLKCIYFEEVDKLLIIERSETEKIFNLSEYYQEKAKKQFGELVENKIIHIDEAILQSEIKNITISRHINNMIENNAFNMSIDNYKKYETYLKKHPEIDDELVQLKIENDRVQITHKDNFRSFLQFTDYNLQVSVIDPSLTFLSFIKRKVKKKTI